MPNPPPLYLPELADNFFRRLSRGNADQIIELTHAYIKAMETVYLRLEALVTKVGTLSAASLHEIYQLSQYKSFMLQLESSLKSYGYTTGSIISAGTEDVLKQAVAASESFLIASGLAAPVIPNINAITAMTGFLRSGGVLEQHIDKIKAGQFLKVRGIMQDAIAFGWHPSEMAKQLTGALGQTLTDTMRLSRTITNYAYRAGTLETYQKNSDVVQGWIWWAELDDKTCMSCVEQHGQIYPLTETMNDHHNGRCAMLPYLGKETIVQQTGEQWFNNLDPAKQEKMMGTTIFDAWKQNKISLSDLSGKYSDPVFGAMRGVPSLTALGLKVKLPAPIPAAPMPAALPKQPKQRKPSVKAGAGLGQKTPIPNKFGSLAEAEEFMKNEMNIYCTFPKGTVLDDVPAVLRALQHYQWKMGESVSYFGEPVVSAGMHKITGSEFAYATSAQNMRRQTLFIGVREGAIDNQAIMQDAAKFRKYTAAKMQNARETEVAVGHLKDSDRVMALLNKMDDNGEYVSWWSSDYGSTGIIQHEIGHLLQATERWSTLEANGVSAKNMLFNDIFTSSPLGKIIMQGWTEGWQYALSKYGTYDIYEFFAETFAAYMDGNIDRLMPELVQWLDTNYGRY